MRVCTCVGVNPTRKPVELFSRGARNVLAALLGAPATKFVAVTGIGAGDSRGHGNIHDDKILQPLLLGTIYADQGPRGGAYQGIHRQLADRPLVTVRPMAAHGRPRDRRLGVTAGKISRRRCRPPWNQLESRRLFGDADASRAIPTGPQNMRGAKDRTLNSLDDLARAGLLAPSDALRAVTARYSVAVTPQIAALIDPADADDPIARQFLPDARELVTQQVELADPIGDDAHSPVPGLVHRYPDRVLLKLLSVCPVYCRFCFRRETVGQGKGGVLPDDALDAALKYIAARPEIFEVILTGGDPLAASPRRLREVATRLAADHACETAARAHARPDGRAGACHARAAGGAASERQGALCRAACQSPARASRGRARGDSEAARGGRRAAVANRAAERRQ